MDPRAGLGVGSISLTGGVGTTVAWAPHFSDTLGIRGAQELGLAANAIGLMAACVIGSLSDASPACPPSSDAELEVSVLHTDEHRARNDYHGVLLAVFWLNCTLILDSGIRGLRRVRQGCIGIDRHSGCQHDRRYPAVWRCPPGIHRRSPGL